MLSKDEYQEKSRLNITRYLKQCYDKGIETDATLMENVDFSEVSSKEFYSNDRIIGNYRVSIKETLAQNCIANLPFEAYEKYVTKDWIKYSIEGDTYFTHQIIFNENLKLIKKIIEKSKPDFGNQEFYADYLRLFLEPLTDIQSLIIRKTDPAFTQKFIDDFYVLFKDLYEQKKELSSHHFYVNKNKTKVDKNKWLDDIKLHSSYGISKQNQMQQFISNLSKSPSYCIFLKDALNQLSISEMDIVHGKDGAYFHALSNYNWEAFEILNQKLKLSPDEIKAKINDFIEKSAIDIYDKNYLFSPKFIKFYKYTKEKNIDIDPKYSLLLFLNDDKKSKDLISIEEIANHDNKNLFLNFTFKDLIVLATMMKDYEKHFKDDFKSKLAWYEKDTSNNSNQFSYGKKPTFLFNAAKNVLFNAPELIEYYNQEPILVSDEVKLEMNNLFDFALLERQIEGFQNLKSYTEQWVKIYSLDKQLPPASINVEKKKKL